MKKKFLILIILILFLLPLSTRAALTLEEINSKITEIEQKILALQEKIQELKEENTSFYFKKRLEIGDSGKEVKELQKLLNKNLKSKVAKTGPGSPGNETSYFGSLTKNAVIQFQEKYSNKILKPWGFKNGTGIVGATTRMQLNKLLHQGEIKDSSFSLSSKNPEQGDVVVLRLENSDEEENITVEFSGKEFNFYRLGSQDKKIAFLPIGANYNPGFYSLVVKSEDRGYYFDYLIVESRDFPKTYLEVTPELEEKGYDPDMIKENVAKENELLFKEVFNKEPTDFYFEKDFVNPLDKIKNVGAYGNLRISGDIKLRHLGVDLDAEVGDPVYSINDGVVSFAREITDYGKTMVVDHGGGIRSLYLHLDKFLAKKGDEVERGEKIALSGNTGYSIAPHLHLSINIYGKSIDPLRFLEIDY